MLFRLLIFRLLPLLLVGFSGERKRMKLIVGLLTLGYSVCLAAAGFEIFHREGVRGIFFLLLSAFPHYLCYGLAAWMLIRCIWSAWSVRVWNRIYRLSILFVILGILAEAYWNPKILQIFLGFSK